MEEDDISKRVKEENGKGEDGRHHLITKEELQKLV